jgi:hypothetical protein
VSKVLTDDKIFRCPIFFGAAFVKFLKSSAILRASETGPAAGRNRRGKNMFKSLMALILSAMVLFVPDSPAASPEHGDLSAVSGENRFRLEKRDEANDCFAAQVEYPVFDLSALDQSVRAWVEGFFALEVAEFKRFCAEREPKLEHRMEFSASPDVFSTRGTVSIEFGIFADTGGAHPGHGVQTLILDAGGKELGYGDLFLKTKGLWNFLSEYAFAALRPTLEKQECWDASMVKDGLAPHAESFRYVVATPEGLTLIFPEYQLVPYVCGGQRCDVPLQVLAKFSPRPGVW